MCRFRHFGRLSIESKFLLHLLISFYFLFSLQCLFYFISLPCWICCNFPLWLYIFTIFPVWRHILVTATQTNRTVLPTVLFINFSPSNQQYLFWKLWGFFFILLSKSRSCIRVDSLWPEHKQILTRNKEALVFGPSWQTFLSNLIGICAQEGVICWCCWILLQQPASAAGPLVRRQPVVCQWGIRHPRGSPRIHRIPFVQMAVGLSCCSLVGWLIVSGCRRWLQNVKSGEKWSPPPFDVPVVIVVVVAVVAVVAILLLTAGAASRIPFGGQATLGINFSLACARYRRHSRGSYRSVRPGGINP